MHPGRLAVMPLLALALGSLGVAQQPPAKPKLPAAEATRFRQLLADAWLSPSPKRHQDVLTRSKQLGERHDLDSLLAALAQGPVRPKGEPKARKVGKQPESLERFGTTVTGFTFQHGDETFRYAIDFPPGYDGSRAHPLLLDPGHGIGKGKSPQEKADFLPFFRAAATGAGLPDALVVRTEILEQIGAGGQRGEQPDDTIVAAFAACLRDVVVRCHVDLDRIVVAGLSMTGYWSWQLGAARADRLLGVAPMGAVTWQVREYLPNFLQLRVAVMHGDQDAVCPVAQPRQTTQDLTAAGVTVRYDEIAGAGHDGKVWSRLGDSLRWLHEGARVHWPKRVQKNLQTLADPWCYWLRLDALQTTGSGKGGAKPTATVRGEVSAQTIALEGSGITRLTVYLHPELLDLQQPITVTWNGKTVHRGRVERSFVAATERVLERADWGTVAEAALHLDVR
jgi:dienelactone hydrolase